MSTNKLNGAQIIVDYLIRENGADINPAGAGIWELPGLGQSKPSIGARYQPA